MIKNLLNRQLTIKDLLDIDEGRIDRSKELDVKLIKIFNVVKEENWLEKFINFFKNKPKLIYYKIFKYEVSSDSGNKYTVFIKVSPSFNVNKFLSNKVQIFCTCADFMYRAAYNLNRKDNVYLNKATKAHLGDALKIAPTKVMTTPICKHIYAAMMYFRNHIRGYDLVR